MNNTFDILFNKHPARLLVALDSEGESIGSSLSREINCTWCHVVNLLNKFESSGLVTTKNGGRKKVITLTDDGLEIVKHIKGVQKRVEEMELRKQEGKKVKKDVKKEEVKK